MERIKLLIIWHCVFYEFCFLAAAQSEGSHPPSALGVPVLIPPASDSSHGVGVHRRFACWGGFGPPVVSAQCPRGSSIRVVRAGLKVRRQHPSSSRCVYEESDCGCQYGETGCNMPNTSKLCNGRSACRVDVTEQYIDTSRCQGFSGYMFIDFTCIATPVSLPSQDINICAQASSNQNNGYIHSPNYPEMYPANQRCHCTLSSPPFSAIVLSILDFHVDDYRCNQDVLQLHYAGHTSKLCGHSNGHTNHLNSDTNRVQLTFSTDQDGSAEGFWIKYQAEPVSPVKVDCYSAESSMTEPLSAVVTTSTPSPDGFGGIGNRRASDMGLSKESTQGDSASKNEPAKMSDPTNENIISELQRSSVEVEETRSALHHPPPPPPPQGPPVIPIDPKRYSPRRTDRYPHYPNMPPDLAALPAMNLPVQDFSMKKKAVELNLIKPEENAPAESGLPRHGFENPGTAEHSQQGILKRGSQEQHIPTQQRVPGKPNHQLQEQGSPTQQRVPEQGLPQVWPPRHGSHETGIPKPALSEVGRAERELPNHVAPEHGTANDQPQAEQVKGPVELNEVATQQSDLQRFGFLEYPDDRLALAKEDRLRKTEGVEENTPQDQKVTFEIVKRPKSRMEQFAKQAPRKELHMLAEPQEGPPNLMVDDNWMKYRDLSVPPRSHLAPDRQGMRPRSSQYNPHARPDRRFQYDDLRNMRRHEIKRREYRKMYENLGDDAARLRKAEAARFTPQNHPRIEHQAVEPKSNLPGTEQDKPKSEDRDSNVESSKADDKSKEKDTTQPWWWNFAVTTPSPMITEAPKATASEILEQLKKKTEEMMPEYYYYMDYPGEKSKEIALDDDSSFEAFDIPSSEDKQEANAAVTPPSPPSQEDSYESPNNPFGPRGLGTADLDARARGLTEAQRRKLRLIQAQMAIIRKQLVGVQAAKKLASEMEKDAKSSVDAVTNSLNSLGDLDPTLLPSIPPLEPEYPSFYGNSLPESNRGYRPRDRPSNSGRYQVLFNELQHSMSTETPTPLGGLFAPNQGNMYSPYPSPGVTRQRPIAYPGQYPNMASKFYPIGGAYVVPTYGPPENKGSVLENSLSGLMNVAPTQSSEELQPGVDNDSAQRENATLSEMDSKDDSDESEEEKIGRRKRIRISKKRKFLTATVDPSEEEEEEDSEENGRYRGRGRFPKRGQNQEDDSEKGEDFYRRGRGPTRRPFDEHSRYYHPMYTKEDPMAKMRAIYNSADTRPPPQQPGGNRPPGQPVNRSPSQPVNRQPDVKSYHMPPPPMRHPGLGSNPGPIQTSPAPLHAAPGSDGSYKVHAISPDDSKSIPTGVAEKQEEESDMTVSIVAGGVVAALIVLIAVGLVVRHFMNKKAHENAIRQRHKRECAMRRTIQQRHGNPAAHSSHGPSPNKP